MFLQRNTAGQVFVIPGSLRAVADGLAVTSATLTVVKDGTAVAAAGTLTHISGGAFKYTPSQAETDCRIFGYVLEGTGAVTVCGSVRTTSADPNSTSLGLVLAKTTNLTGLNDVAATAIVSGGAIATGGGAVATVTNLTNLPTMPTDWLTAAGLSAGAVTRAQAGLSTYAGADTAGTTTLLARIPGIVQPQAGDAFTRLGAPAGVSISADIQTRSTYAGGAVASVTGSVGGVTGIVSADVIRAGGVGLAPAAAGYLPADVRKVAGTDPTISPGGIDVNLNQTGLVPRALDSVPDNALTLGDVLAATVAIAAGRMTRAGTALTLKTPAGTTVRTFALDSPTDPTSRT